MTPGTFIDLGRIGYRLAKKRTLNPRRIKALTSNYLKHRNGQQPVHGPSVLMIDPSSLCQLKCTGCDTGLGTGPRGQFLDLDLFKSIIDQWHDSLLWVGLYRRGEPTLHPQLKDMISHLSEHRIGSFISTNGEEVDVEEILSAGLDWMLISISGTQQSVHEQYHRGGNLDRVRNNVQQIIHERRRRGLVSPHVRLRYLAHDGNRCDQSQLADFSKQLGADSIEIRPLRPEIPEQSHIPRRCLWPWLATVVDANGDVNQCCHSSSRNYTRLGVINNKSNGQDIWNSLPYRQLRLSFSGTADPACLGCHHGLDFERIDTVVT